MRSIVAASATLMLLALPSYAEDVELPAFKSWANQPIGTSVKVRSLTVCPASIITTTTTYKLIKVNEDRAILEIVKVSDATGKTVENLPDIYEQKRMFPLFPGIKKEDIGKPPKNATAKGEETLTVGGREIKTFWYDVKSMGDAGETETRTWLADDVPNRLVKAVTKIPKATTTVTLELLEIKTP